MSLHGTLSHAQVLYGWCLCRQHIMSTLHLEVASFLKFKDAFDTSICDVRCFKINKRTKRVFFYVLLAYSDTYHLNSCSVFLFNLSIIYWYTLEAQFLREKRSCFFVPIPKCYYNTGIFCRTSLHNTASTVDFY